MSRPRQRRRRPVERAAFWGEPLEDEPLVRIRPVDRPDALLASLGEVPLAVNPAEARLVGVKVTWMLGLGWGLAAMFGAVAGLMVAPVVFLDPNMMGGIQLYAFAAATVGGFTSPLGAVVGGLLVGVTENLVGTYVRFIGTELKLTVALAMIIIVLLVKPSGLFGRTTVRRV